MGNPKPQEALSENSLSSDKLQSPQATIHMGLEREHKLNNSMEETRNFPKYIILLKGCVCYIFASLFCMFKREHL